MYLRLYSCVSLCMCDCLFLCMLIWEAVNVCVLGVFGRVCCVSVHVYYMCMHKSVYVCVCVFECMCLYV